MKWQPHDYQMRAISLMLGQGAAGLFLDPGLGKTSVTLAAFKILKDKGLAKKMLVVAPLRPMELTWPNEIRKWDTFSGLTHTILHGREKEANLHQEVDVYLINPEGLKWLYDRPNKPRFDIICVDESTKFKDSQTKRFKLLKEHIATFNRRWILTGTPVPNGLMDLFGQIFILDLGRALGRYITHYRNRYFYNPNVWDPYTWAARPGAFEEITERIAPLVLRLKAEDYIKMPELVDIDVHVQLPPEAAEQYKSIEDEFYAQIAGQEIVAENAAVAGGKCRQICNGALYYHDKDKMSREWVPVHNAKLDALEDLLEELGGAPVIIMYEFNHDLDRIRDRFGKDLPIFTGLTGSRLVKLEADFNEGKIPILLGHPSSMALGLNLQGACHHVIWFGMTWNYGDYDQSIRRVRRQGQKSTQVFNYRIVAMGTVDERVGLRLIAKRNLQEALNEAIQEKGNS